MCIFINVLLNTQCYCMQCMVNNCINYWSHNYIKLVTFYSLIQDISIEYQTSNLDIVLKLNKMFSNGNVEKITLCENVITL